VKLIPYESVIAIGDDAVTITNSENILKLDDAGDYEALLDDNIRVIGTKAITKSGTIQGKITELYIGDDGKIEKCEITGPDGNTSDVTCDQISIFGKQVTVIDPNGTAEEKKTKPVSAPAPAAPKEEPKEEPAPEAPQAEEKPEEPAKVEEKAEEPAEAPKAEAKPEPKKAEPAKAADSKQAAADKATEERHRRFLLGKKAARTIKMDNGIVIVEAGADITEEVLQKAKLANKFIELSMNVQ
jgi:type IV secretory pathway VirB10-like protein